MTEYVRQRLIVPRPRYCWHIVRVKHRDGRLAVTFCGRRILCGSIRPAVEGDVGEVCKTCLSKMPAKEAGNHGNTDV